MKGNVYIRQKGTHQAHVIMGCMAYDINHPRRIALYLMNNLLLNDISKQLGTNRTYLLQALSVCAHMTFKEYINRKRINHAEQLMDKYPQKPKTEIATLSGYNSMSSFYRNYSLYHS